MRISQVLVPYMPQLSRLCPQMSHLFNVAHTLRMLVQKERSLDILKVSWTWGSCLAPCVRPWKPCARHECPWAPQGDSVASAGQGDGIHVLRGEHAD